VTGKPSFQERPRIGLLGLTLEFYEEGFPQVRRERENWVRREVLPRLRKAGVDIRFEGAAFTAEAVERQIQAFEASGCDALLVMLLTYSTSLTALTALQRTRLPLLIWNTQELFAITPAFSSADLVANHGVHGTFDLANVLLRQGVRFGYHTSHLQDPGSAEELAALLRAAAAVHRLRGMRIGLLGHPFPGMGDFSLDATHFRGSLGPLIETITLSEYQAALRNVRAEAIRARVAEYRKRYAVDRDISRRLLEATARAEEALRRLVTDRRCDAITYQFLAFGKDPSTETLPFVAACRLMAEGVGFGGEGDVIAAAFTTTLQSIQPPAGFSEIFTIDFAGHRLLLAHMGEANPALAHPGYPIRLRRRSPIVPVRVGQLTLVFSNASGPYTLAALTPGPRGEWRLIFSRMEVPDAEPFAQAETPQSLIRPAGDVRRWLTAYAQAGGPHHLALCRGDARALLRLWAHLAGITPIEIE